MRRSVLLATVVALVVGSAAAWQFFGTRDTQSVHRKTYLGVAPHAFDESGAVPALLASVRSDGDADTSATIDLYWTVPGGSEEHGAEATTTREPGDAPLALEYALPAAEFPSGTTVRATFRIRSTDGWVEVSQQAAIP